MNLSFDFFGNIGRSWPLIVHIWEVRGSSERLVITRGARIKGMKGGPDEIEFKGLMKTDRMPAPAYDWYGMTSKGQSVLEVFSPKAGIFVPMKRRSIDIVSMGQWNSETKAWEMMDIKYPMKGLKVELSDASIDQWRIMKSLELKDLIEKEKQWWETILPWVPPLAFAVIFLVGMLLAFGPLQTMSANISGASGNFVTAADTLSKLFSGAVQVVGGPNVH